ncbi:MAG: hypothetical protein JNL39_17495 [Opitutaceae bacterium]|nr:hypothetical protein [Opitutaceae bacterium]
MNSQPPLLADDLILKWLLRVARRADTAVRLLPADRAQDRRVWLRAEQEVFALIERGAEAALVTER